MAEDETKAFDAYIMRTVKSLFCGRESKEIRFLNENGVVFEMEYTDPRGKTVTKLTIEPRFLCLRNCHPACRSGATPYEDHVKVSACNAWHRICLMQVG